MGLIATVGLVLHPARDSGTAAKEIMDWSAARNVTMLGLPGEAGRLPGPVQTTDRAELAARSDLIISLGGDGTMLRAMRLVCGGGPPVLGVNVGRLGFLAEIDVPELAGALSAIDGHDFTVEPRAGVQAVFGDVSTIAFNDIALVRSPGHKSAAVAVRVEDHSFVRYAADAVIAATPTGSTAYAFSAGGPIVSPRAEGLLVIPVAPHSAFNRALFLAGGEALVLEILADSGDLVVEADGQVAGRLCPGDAVQLTLLPAVARVVRLGRTTFYQRARRKLRVMGSAEIDGDEPYPDGELPAAGELPGEDPVRS